MHWGLNIAQFCAPEPCSSWLSSKLACTELTSKYKGCEREPHTEYYLHVSVNIFLVLFDLLGAVLLVCVVEVCKHVSMLLE